MQTKFVQNGLNSEANRNSHFKKLEQNQRCEVRKLEVELQYYSNIGITKFTTRITSSNK